MSNQFGSGLSSEGPAVVDGCPRCKAGDYTREARGDALSHRITVSPPSVVEIEEWLSESGAETTDGCRVEPDGVCPHGHSSWLRVLGLI